MSEFIRNPSLKAKEIINVLKELPDEFDVTSPTDYEMAVQKNARPFLF